MGAEQSFEAAFPWLHGEHDKLRETPIASACIPWTGDIGLPAKPCRSYPVEETQKGFLGRLTPEQERLLKQLEQRLELDPEPSATPQGLEGRRRRLLRFLRDESWDVDMAHCRLHEYAKWWKEYGMDNFNESDEFDEQGPLFVCGTDRWGRPILIARPASHHSDSFEESITAARRCVYTVQRCVERLPPGMEQVLILYDVFGLRPRHLDLTLAQEVVKQLDKRFPERLSKLLVINHNIAMWFFWAAVSVLLDPRVKAKIQFCEDCHSQLLEFMDCSHPYYRYVDKMNGLSYADAAQCPLPSSDPYVPRWQDAVAADRDADSVSQDVIPAYRGCDAVLPEQTNVEHVDRPANATLDAGSANFVVQLAQGIGGCFRTAVTAAVVSPMRCACEALDFRKRERPRFKVGVICSDCDAHEELAAPLGKLLAAQGVDLLTGGGGGTMQSVSRAFVGVRHRKGIAIGMLPCVARDSSDSAGANMLPSFMSFRREGDMQDCSETMPFKPPGYPNKYIELVMQTHHHNPSTYYHSLVLSCDAVIALPGDDNIASQCLLARGFEKPFFAYLGEKGEIQGLARSDFPVADNLEAVKTFLVKARSLAAT